MLTAYVNYVNILLNQALQQKAPTKVQSAHPAPPQRMPKAAAAATFTTSIPHLRENDSNGLNSVHQTVTR